jgi:hypothetical protein
VIRTALVMIAAVLLGTCSQSNSGEPACRGDGDCQGTQTCIRGACEAARCDSDAQCGEVERCSANATCVVVGECVADSDCDGADRCGSFGRCLAAGVCDADDDCAHDYGCDRGSCEPTGRACVDNDPPSCPEGQRCTRDHVCIAQGSCVEDGDCPPNHSCTSNYSCAADDPCGAGCAADELCSFTGGCVPEGSCALNADCSTVSAAEVCGADFTCIPGEHCGQVRFSPVRTPSNLLLVVDRSGSMRERWGEGPSRWEMATETIAQVVDAYHEQLDFGLMLFPGGWETDELCRAGELVLGMGEATPESVRDEMRARRPFGGTPTRATLQTVLSDPAYFGLDDPSATNAILLITDGGANCDSCEWCTSPADEEAVNPVIRQLAALSPPILTYVVGFHMFWEDTNFALNCHAQAGGTAQGGCVRGQDCHWTEDPCYRRVDYTPNEPDWGAGALNETLAGIIWSTSSCAFILPRDPPNPEKMWVYADDGTTYTLMPPDPWRADGWDYSPQGRVLTMFGTACEPFATRVADVLVVLGCVKP